MRIVHLSDIHLSEDNFDEFHDNYLEALINDLADFHSTNNIDLIVITGDLVDKGGHSLLGMKEFEGFDSPYEIFEKVFIKPISSFLGLGNENFLFIPGNHDIDENGILWVDEKSLKEKLSKDTIKEQLKLNERTFNSTNKRIQTFKEFEKKFHKETINYEFTNNESTYLFNDKVSNSNIGFILINDSWRCSTCQLKDSKLNNHYVGIKQFYWAIEKLKQLNQGVDLDKVICLFHHSIEEYTEKEEVKRFLINKDVDLFLYGHHHSIKSEYLFTPMNGCHGFRGRAALNKPDEQIDIFQPGYQIIDIDLLSNRISQIYHRKYVFNSSMFAPDTTSAPPLGVDNNSSRGSIGYEFSQKTNNSNYLGQLKLENFKRE
ncbi:metallophosphoesterase [Lacinutrix sp. MedPE-SW]|uniref:metallophosphoesterase family protein n=1 Tax=Lacinutrix sp. MedPE-SW TaxID=1860087 RepID=UPI0009217C2B|nr:metallophosphoesterase [Lacinutrix sp. MedPE-SW]OIQ23826.1 MAG: hypothetical protein BM549_00545 [Lacinutrix sp. MedPE-SW]